jgi:hypothetical protein
MSGSGVRPEQQKLTQSTERAKEQAARRVPNKTAKIPRKPTALEEQIEQQTKLMQEQIRERDERAMHSVLAPLRITGENIFWGQHVPSKPKEIIWGGEIFARLPKEQQKHIYTLSNSIRSGNNTAENMDKYKIALDSLIRLNPQTSITLKTLITSKLKLDNINIIKAYWNRYNFYDYSIEPDEIYFFIFDWISKNSVFTEERFVIFNQFISDRIRSKVEESRIPSPEPDPYPEFNRRKRELIIRLYLYPDINTQEVLNYFMNDEEQDRFKPRLMRELNLRQTKCNEIYELAETLAEFNPRMVIEDCMLLENQLRRITQRMQKLYPMYRDEQVYPVTQSHSIIDSLLQQELFSRFMSNEELQPQVEFIDYTSQIKKLAKSYRTTEFECLKTIENLHKKPEEENLKGGGKTRKNKRKN